MPPTQIQPITSLENASNELERQVRYRNNYFSYSLKNYANRMARMVFNTIQHPSVPHGTPQSDHLSSAASGDHRYGPDHCG